MHYLIHGPNLFDAEERVARLRQELDPSGFGTTVLDIPRAKVSDIQSALQAAPFFGGSRIVVVRGPASVSTRTTSSDDDAEDEDTAEDTASGRKLEWRDVVEILPTTPTSTQLIIWISGAAPTTHAMLKFAREHTWNIEIYRIPRGAELMAWVSNRVTREGTTITPDAVEHLLDLLYPTLWRGEQRWETGSIDMRLIASEIAKLACGADATGIDRHLVDELVVDRGGYSAFKLSDQLFGGNREGALIELERMLGAGEPAERIVHQLSGDIGLRWAIAHTRDIEPDLVAGAQKTSVNRVNNARRHNATSNTNALAASSELLRAAEWGVKSGRIRDTTAAVVPLVLEISNAFSRVAAPRGRR